MELFLPLCLWDPEEKIMKRNFYKSMAKVLLLAGSVFLICNCGDDTGSSASENEAPAVTDENAYVVTSASWLYDDGTNKYIVYPETGIVTDIHGTPVATAVFTEAGTFSAVASDGITPIALDVNLATLPVLQPVSAWILEAASTYYIKQDMTVSDAAGATIGVYDPNSLTILALDGTQIVGEVDLATLPVQLTGEYTIIEPNLPEIPPPNDIVTESSSSEAIIESSSEILPESSSAVIPVPESSSTEVIESSSSIESYSSSSEEVIESSSSAPESFTIKYVSGGRSGSGWATRYWDCCKPHCAWPDKGGLKARTCDASGKEVHDDSDNSSMCKGGQAGTCKDQIPYVYNDTIAFAFAAVPGSAGGECGKCFDLQFTGEGKYATDRHKKLKGKHLIVIASNIGYDVEQGQFDVMIPGGGFGIFDGCSSKMGWGDQGERYGGLLSACENETKYYAPNYQKCLITKCEKAFSMDEQAKEGCLFLANWMNAAGNPLHNYKEVECPKQLLDRF